MDEIIVRSDKNRISVSGVIAAFFCTFLIAFTIDLLLRKNDQLFTVERFLIAVIAAVMVTLVYIILYSVLSCKQLTVTKDEIRGHKSCGKEIVIPLSDVISVQLTNYLFKGITVSTNVQKVSFFFLPTPQEFHQAIHHLILDRQLQETKNFTKQQEEIKQQTEALLKKVEELSDTAQKQ